MWVVKGAVEIGGGGGWISWGRGLRRWIVADAVGDVDGEVDGGVDVDAEVAMGIGRTFGAGAGAGAGEERVAFLSFAFEFPCSSGGEMVPSCVAEVLELIAGVQG